MSASSRVSSPAARTTVVALAVCATALAASGCRPGVTPGPAPAAVVAPARPWGQVRGWTILTDDEAEGMAVIARAREYGINHLQISHRLIMNLREARDEERRARVLRLTQAAHAAGIREVVVWDHALYSLRYYPERFRTGPEATLDLDNPAFWEWFKQDYRDMLALLPGIDGLVLTFVETGARAERQHSLKLKTGAERLAAVVNAAADVVVGEHKLQLYARTFAYTRDEYDVVLGALRFLARPEVRLLMKEVPHDFFLTHPPDLYAGSIPRATVIEFDAGNEFNGQGQIANTWPEVMLQRWGELSRRGHVIGQVARVDRYGRSRILGRPSEILLYALKRQTEDPTITAGTIHDEFIAARYGRAAVPHLRPAFESALDVVTSALYTLGTSTADHSALDYDPYQSSYARHVSGKWLEPPVVRVGHGVDRELHYWKDVIQHLAPARLKQADGPLAREAPWVLAQGWVTAEEKMSEAFLGLVIKEKAFGVTRAEQALAHVQGARAALLPADFADLHAYFERTLLTARLHRAVAAAYFGYRVWARGDGFQTPALAATVREALAQIPAIAGVMKAHAGPIWPGAWKWAKDADEALAVREKIAVRGWPEYGGVVFPLGGGGEGGKVSAGQP
jgi:hypothetical protein